MSHTSCGASSSTWVGGTVVTRLFLFLCSARFWSPTSSQKPSKGLDLRWDVCVSGTNSNVFRLFDWLFNLSREAMRIQIPRANLCRRDIRQRIGRFYTPQSIGFAKVLLVHEIDFVVAQKLASHSLERVWAFAWKLDSRYVLYRSFCLTRKRRLFDCLVKAIWKNDRSTSSTRRCLRRLRYLGDRSISLIVFFCTNFCVLHMWLYTIINDEFGCEVVQAKVPIHDGTT